MVRFFTCATAKCVDFARFLNKRLLKATTWNYACRCCSEEESLEKKFLSNVIVFDVNKG